MNLNKLSKTRIFDLNSFIQEKNIMEAIIIMLLPFDIKTIWNLIEGVKFDKDLHVSKNWDNSRRLQSIVLDKINPLYLKT